MRDRPTTNPGGMQCERCDQIFIGDEWHSLCGECIRYVLNVADEERRKSESQEMEAHFRKHPHG